MYLMLLGHTIVVPAHFLELQLVVVWGVVQLEPINVMHLLFAHGTALLMPALIVG